MYIKSFDGSFLVQNRNNEIVRKKNFRCVTKLKPSKKELDEIEFAFNISKYVKSNAIVLCNNFSTIGIGGGQPSRVDSCKIAIQKARKFQPKQIAKAIAASDAFFPFSEIINYANKAKRKMLFTGIRHFYH
jgi:phosphoribosylaminoimidazolecarboxamide formyltransferase/IMP cyclohydrolase